ncbi:hypothetical protein ATANTOWER_022367 [Ataeniobius toweri]|uniref:Uncharacterized protein n=1 Tax=Ataeniobius toweri TaxID=208326 RepID=A0ABU7BJP6_9TELE|nr:hypothetical protein [Ataeniobius toweri]
MFIIFCNQIRAHTGVFTNYVISKGKSLCSKRVRLKEAKAALRAMHHFGATVVTLVAVRPVTGGLPVPTHFVCGSRYLLGQDISPAFLLMVVRGLGGADWHPSFCQSDPGPLWLQCSLPLSVCE